MASHRSRALSLPDDQTEVDVEKLQAAAEKVGEAIDREFEKRDKRINDLEYRIRAWEERNGRS